jgi:hypothetical protein
VAGEAYARARADADEAQTAASAAASFVASHLRCYAEMLLEKLAGVEGPAHLVLAGRALSGVTSRTK